MGKIEIGKTIEEVLKNVSEGDSGTIASLLKELDQKVRNTLLHQGHELRDIEEIILDSLTIFIQKVRRGDFEDRGIPVIVYLIKIARIRSHQYLRNHKKHLLPLTNDIIVQCNAELKSLEDWDRVNAAINDLPSNQRKLIELTYFRDMSDLVILERKLSPYSSIESIRTQRHKAIKKLTELLNHRTGR